MFQLILECCRARPDSGEIRRLAGACAGWDQFARVASGHGVAPLAFWALNQSCPDAVPPEVLARLRAAFQECTRRNLLFARELHGILETFRKAGIQAAVLKGPALAWSVYEAPGLRSTSDLDLLVAERDVSRAADLLLAGGFRRKEPGADLKFFANAGELLFLRGDPLLAVDLHWSLTPASFSGLDSAAFLTRLVEIDLAGQPAPAFCPEDLVVYLCVHGCAHGWSSLKWLCDVAHVLDVRDVNWERILSRSKEMGASRKVSLGVYLAHDLLGARLPQEVLSRVSDARTLAFAASVAAHIRAGPMPGTLASTVSELRLADGVSGKWRSLWGRLMPTFYDWKFCRFPKPLFAMYYLARPLRLAWQFVRWQDSDGTRLTEAGPSPGRKAD